jgi:hypothetical protein
MIFYPSFYPGLVIKKKATKIITSKAIAKIGPSLTLLCSILLFPKELPTLKKEQ